MKNLQLNYQNQQNQRTPMSNRHALIQATLDSIAEVGISETTVSNIIKRANLSRGMIHLHFGSKEALFVAAAQTISDDYYSKLEKRLSDFENNPPRLIIEIVHSDLSPEIMNERTVAIWHAFRGVARTNANIAKYSSTRDKRLRKTILDAYRKILPKNLNNVDIAQDATFGTLALLEGMWSDYFNNPNAFDRDAAARLVIRFLDAISDGQLSRSYENM